jgi:hypothetical protein
MRVGVSPARCWFSWKTFLLPFSLKIEFIVLLVRVNFRVSDAEPLCMGLKT